MIKELIDSIRLGDAEELVFEQRYSVGESLARRRNKESFNNWKKENTKSISSIGGDRPYSISWFDSLFTSDIAVESIITDKNRGRKIVGTFCNLVPEELIYASGARPIRLCSGANHTIKAAETVYPRDCCDLIKSSLGTAIDNEPFAGLCDSIVIPATCDGKKKLGEIMNEIVPIWMLDLPQSRDRAQAKSYWLTENKLLKKKLEVLTGQKIDRKSLRQAIMDLQERNIMLRKIQEYRRKALLSGRDALIIIQGCFFADLHEWMKHADLLFKELDKKQYNHQMENPQKKARIMISGSPLILPNTKIADIIEGHGALIVADMTCSGGEFSYDAVVPDDWSMHDMMLAVSERYLLPSMCPCFMKSEDRIDKALDLVRENKIEGVVYVVLRHCLLFDIEARKLKEALAAKGIPFLQIMTDYSPEDKEQLRTRVEAFIEMIAARK